MDSLDASLLGFVGLLLPLSLRRYRRDPRISKTISGAALLLLFSVAGTVLSYLVVATNLPLVDETLAMWDRAMGFDWMAFSTWLHDRPRLMMSLNVAYGSGLPQLIVVVVFLGISGRHARLEEFLRLYFVAVLIVIAISGPFPAEGPWKYYGVDAATFDLASLSHFELLREGGMLDIPLGGATQGLVSMPSLHAATALLLVYAMRRTALFPASILLNAAMLVSTPIVGGHYLVDVIAGVALAVSLIMMDRVGQRHASSDQPANHRA
jgi:membrane-associated phospholipid phosphatase